MLIRFIRFFLCGRCPTVVIGLVFFLYAHAILAAHASLQFSGAQLQRQQSTVLLDGAWDIKRADTENWTTLSSPFFFNRSGHFVVRKTLQLDSAFDADTYLLFCDGVEGKCSVYLDQQFIGGNAVSGLPFDIIIENKTLPAQSNHLIELEIDNRLEYRSTIPLKKRLYGLPVWGKGIYGSVGLTRLSDVYIDTVIIDSVSILQNRLLFDLRLQLNTNSVSDFLCQTKITSTGSSAVLYQGRRSLSTLSRSGILEFSRVSLPFYGWSIESPQSYSLLVTLFSSPGSKPIDEIKVDFAIPPDRKAYTFPQDIKAIGYVQDRSLMEMSPDSISKRLFVDLRSIKRCGANTVRCYGATPLPQFLSVCDSLGLFAMVEIPLLDVPPDLLGQDSFRERVEKHFYRFIKTFQHHPSIIAWGLGNGYIADCTKTQSFIKNLVTGAKRLDDRPFYISLATPAVLPSLGIDFYIYDMVDENNKIDYNALHLLGQDCLPSIRVAVEMSGKDNRFCEKYHAHQMRNVFTELVKSSWKGGMLQSPFMDWYGDAAYCYWGPRSEMTKNISGISSAAGVERPAYQVVNSFFNQEPIPDILYKARPSDSFMAFQIPALGLLLLFLLMLKNDKRLQTYLKRVYRFPHGFIVDLQENRKVSSFLTLFIGAISLLSVVIILAGWIYCLKTNILFNKILIYIFPQPQMLERVIWLIWHPLWFILFLFFGIFVIVVFLCMVIRLYFFLSKPHIHFSQIFSFCVWINAHLLFSLPLSVIFIKAYTMPEFHILIAAYVVTMLLWTAGRYFRGFRLFLQLGVVQMFVVIAVFMLLCLLTGYVLHLENACISYFYYFYLLAG